MRRFYVTTPIYYVNDTPHIGHAYTTVAADAIARYKRLKGYEVLFLTGTDEHGQKVEKAAAKEAVTPRELANRVVVRYQELWKKLSITNDDFIRTTEKRHALAVEALWRKVGERGDIYLGEYEDWYCVPCESFVTEKELAAGRCPACGREVEKLKEKGYFFRLSKYAEPILAHIRENPGFIGPPNRRNEIASFLKEGLRDLSVTRPAARLRWGIKVPDDPEHTIYVWFDALANYLTADGWPQERKFWPASIHIIGKDILRFHAVYWPAFLMSAGLALPERIFAHGWWTVEGQKMSKSLGNVVDPFGVVEKFGVDRLRYFLLREFPFAGDGDFSYGAVKERTNSELANELGNLLSRTIALVMKNRKDGFPKEVPAKDRMNMEMVLKMRFEALCEGVEHEMENLGFYETLTLVLSVIKQMNAYVDRSAPWAEKDPATLSNTLYTLCEGLRIIAVYLYPFMPQSAQKIWMQLGIEKKIEGSSFDREVRWGGGEFDSTRIEKGAPLFPRVE
jgi:methionyl-tRNA synthetase